MATLTKEEQALQQEAKDAAELNADIRKGNTPDCIVVAKSNILLLDSNDIEKALQQEAIDAAKLNADINNGATPDRISLSEMCKELKHSNTTADQILGRKKPKR